MASLRLEQVSKVFPGDVRAVKRLSLDIEDGEFVTLVGPSGCGKTTTLRLIAGLDQPSEGVIEIAGRSMEGVSPALRDIAMVFQQPALLPHKTVARNLAFGLQVRGQQWQEIQSSVTRVAGLLGMDSLLERLPGQLSGGERQRVSLGKALVRRPAVYLLDEPLASLDGPLRLELRRELKQQHQRLAASGDCAATMIYVTHDQAEALTLGQRVAVLDRGELQQIGSPQEVYDNPHNTMVARFIGLPPMNLLPGDLRQENDRITFVHGSWSVPVDKARHKLVKQLIGRQVLLGIRAEDVRLAAGDSGPLSTSNLANKAEIVTAEVADIEPLGDSTLVYLRLGNAPDRSTSPRGIGDGMAVSRMESRVRLMPDERIQVYFDMQRVHFFDPATGRNVNRSEIATKGN
ncbi:MAG: ABC transporter ATP-binding protein [Pirellulales bacterium]